VDKEMRDRLLTGTKKGLFELRRDGGDWTIAATHFLGDPISMLLADPRDGALYAAVALGHFGVKLHRSRDGGESWQELPAPAFPKTDSEGPSVSYLFCLELAGADRPGWIWCGAIPGALFLSKDHGESWTLNQALWDLPERKDWMGGGFDHAGVASICVDPRNSRHITIGVSTGGVWRSDDAGASWRPASEGMYAEYYPPPRNLAPEVQDVHRLVQCRAAPDTMWVQHHNGVFRSTDGARSWQEVTTIRPAKFGFAVAVHPRDPDTAWFVPGVKDECRIPVDARLVVARTRNGARSFEVLTEGLPQSQAYDLVYRHALDVDDSGSRLAMGSTTGHLWVTENGGDAWILVAGNLPPINCVRFG
jgi:hypothetical protein